MRKKEKEVWPLNLSKHTIFAVNTPKQPNLLDYAVIYLHVLPVFQPRDTTRHWSGLKSEDSDSPEVKVSQTVPEQHQIGYYMMICAVLVVSN